MFVSTHKEVNALTNKKNLKVAENNKQTSEFEHLVGDSLLMFRTPNDDASELLNR